MRTDCFLLASSRCLSCPLHVRGGVGFISWLFPRSQNFGFVDKTNIKTEVVSTCIVNVYLVLMAIPGYYAAVYLIDKWGRRRLQLLGFAAMAVNFLIIGLMIAWLKTSAPAFFIVRRSNCFLLVVAVASVVSSAHTSPLRPHPLVLPPVPLLPKCVLTQLQRPRFPCGLSQPVCSVCSCCSSTV